MELQHLRYFLTVAKMLNISHAAAHHTIPQPAMSQTISRLEQELGTPLFDRYKNKLTLTARGEEFYRRVSAAVAELDAAVQNLYAEDGALGGELSLLVLNHRDTMLDCIIAFKALYPDVSFKLYHLNDSLEECDLCISCTPPSEKYSESRCLITEKLQLLVSKTHPLAEAPTVDFGQLKDERFAMFRKQSSLWEQTMHLCHRSGFEPKISMVCQDLYCMMKYIAAGSAVTLGPVASWRGVKTDSVVFIPTEPEAVRATYVFWDAQKPKSRLREVFLTFLTDYFSTAL